MRQWLIIGAIVIVLLGAFIWNRNRNSQLNGEVIAPEEIITQDDGTIIKKTGDLVEEISAEEADAKKQEISQKLTNASPITLKAVDNQSGNGTSSRSFDNGVYYQRVDVEGMAPLQKGYFYGVSLAKPDGTKISIGRIDMTGSKGSLLYSVKEDRTAYTKVSVNRETEGNAAAGQVVLTGEFQ